MLASTRFSLTPNFSWVLSVPIPPSGRVRNADGTELHNAAGGGAGLGSFTQLKLGVNQNGTLEITSWPRTVLSPTRIVKSEQDCSFAAFSSWV
jgi:hypothetical protein